YQMIASGDSYAAAAKMFNDRQLPCWHYREGEGLVQEPILWPPNRVKRILSNPVYLGQARSGNGHVNDDAHQALVSPQTWTRAQRQRGRKQPTAKPSPLLPALIPSP